jgi:uncharacterized protein
MNDLVQQTEAHIRQLLSGEGTGHDWYHIDRVRKLALQIGAKEGADPLIVELGALLHDIADHKFHGGDHEIGHQQAREWLRSLQAPDDLVATVGDIVERISFSAAKGPMMTLEGKVVQDADRLEALGAIGIARCFATGGYRQRPLYNPADPQVETSVKHFYDKLLLLQDRMNTETGRAIAQDRTAYMQAFLDRFYEEWQAQLPREAN